MFFLAATLVGWIGGDFVYRKVTSKYIFLWVCLRAVSPRGGLNRQSWVDRRTFLQFKADSTGAELNLRLYQLDERLTSGRVSGLEGSRDSRLRWSQDDMHDYSASRDCSVLRQITVLVLDSVALMRTVALMFVYCWWWPHDEHGYVTVMYPSVRLSVCPFDRQQYK